MWLPHRMTVLDLKELRDTQPYIMCWILKQANQFGMTCLVFGGNLNIVLFGFNVNFVICDEDVWLCEKFLILKTQPEIIRGKIGKFHK